MTDSIVEKLQAHSSSPVDTECKAVCLLCEVRKLLERYPRFPAPFALWLYCCWALHVDLTQAGTTMPFLERVDKYVINKLNGPETGETIVAEEQLFREFVYFDSMRAELALLLHSYDLPTSLCDEDKQWFAFLASYGGIIEDGSISCRSKQADKLKMVSKVTFLKSAPPHVAEHVPFEIEWNILLKDGRQLEVEVGTWGPNENHRQWGLRLVSA